MARITLLFLLLTNTVIPALFIDVDKITVYPKHSSFFGVFHVSLRGPYAFNASAARAVCQQLGVTIADMAQVVKAQGRGLETCRFGWIDEQVAVIPRIETKSACGQGKVGVIVWRADLTTTFDAFCFNLTDFEAQARVTTAHVQQTTTLASHAGGGRPETAPPASGTPHRSATPCLSCSGNSTQGLEEDSSSPVLSMGVMPTTLLVVVAVFTLVLAAAAAVWCSRTGFRSRMKEECIEAQVHDSCSEKVAKEPDTEAQSRSVENPTDVGGTLDQSRKDP